MMTITIEDIKTQIENEYTQQREIFTEYVASYVKDFLMTENPEERYVYLRSTLENYIQSDEGYINPIDSDYVNQTLENFNCTLIIIYMSHYTNKRYILLHRSNPLLEDMNGYINSFINSETLLDNIIGFIMITPIFMFFGIMILALVFNTLNFYSTLFTFGISAILSIILIIMTQIQFKRNLKNCKLIRDNCIYTFSDR